MKPKKSFLFAIVLALLFSSSSISYAASNEKELFVVAQRAFEDGFYDVSLRYVDQLLKEFPQTTKYVEARLLEGQCYFFKKQYLKSFNLFQELAKRSEYKDVTLFWLGETYLKVGDNVKAADQYRQLVETYPNSLYAPQAYYSLAWSYFEKGEYDKAKQVFLKLIELFPSNNLVEDASFKIGECDYNAGLYEGAVFQFQKYVGEHPKSRRSFDAYFNVAESYYYLEQFTKASDAYKKARALTADPKEILTTIVGAGWALFKAEKYEDSLKAFDEAQAHAKVNNIPEDDVLLGKASLFSAQDKQKEALVNYSDLIERFPQSTRLAESYLGRANMFYLVNDYPSAIRDYQKIIELFSANPQYQSTIEKARFGLAWTYLKNGSLDLSIESFKGILEKTESKSVKTSAMAQIGDAYQEAGQFEKAIETYDKILREMPDTPYSDYVQYRLGVALLKAGKVDVAVLAFQALQVNYPKSKFLPESKYYLGVAYFKKRDWGAAIEALTPFVQGVSKESEFTPEAQYLIALSFFNQKLYDKAVGAFNDLLKAYPNQESIVQQAQSGLAKAKYEMGNTKEGLALFKEIAFRYTKTESALEALLWMGQHAMAAGLYERAEEHYAQVVGDFPQHEKAYFAHFELGRALHAQGKLDKALEQYRQVGGQDGDYAVKAKLAIADIFSQELDPIKAIETYQNIIATSPEFKRDALVKIGKIRRKTSGYDDELKAYADALEAPLGSSQVSNAEIQFLIGDTYEAMLLPDKAVEAYFKIPYVYSKVQAWVVKAYLRIGKIYENNEEWDKALAAYGKVVELKADESKFAQERILSITDNKKK